NPELQIERTGLIACSALSPLDVGGPSHGIHDARELNQHRISGHLAHASAMPLHVRLHDLLSQRLPAAQGFGFIDRHEMGETCDVSKGYGGEPPLDRRWGLKWPRPCELDLGHWLPCRRPINAKRLAPPP